MLRIFQLVGQADDLLEHSWRQRKWATFIRIWLIATFWLALMSLLSPFIFLYVPVSIDDGVAFVIGWKIFALSFFDLLWTLAMPLAAMVGLSTLIFTVPVMLLKQVSGEFTTQ